MTEQTDFRLSQGGQRIDWTKSFDPAKSPSMTKLSLHEITTKHWSLRREVAACAEFGIDAIGVWRWKLEDFGEERGIELLRDSGLTVSSVSWAGGFTGANGMSFNEAVDDAREALRIAGELNASCLVIAAGGRGGHTLNHASTLLREGLKHLADFAAEENVFLALQPMRPMFSENWSFLSTLNETLAIIRDCGCPQVKIAVDVWQIWQEPRLLERIPALVPHVAIVQIGDGIDPPASENDRCLPGDGEIPLGEITQAFVAAGYDGFFEMALWSEELWNSDYFELMAQCRTRFDTHCRR